MCLSTVETGKDGRPKVRGPVVAFKLFTGRLHEAPIAGRLYGPNYTYPHGGYVSGRWYRAIGGTIYGSGVAYPAGYHALRDASTDWTDPEAAVAYGWRAVLLSGITATGRDGTVTTRGRGIVARRMRIFSKRDSLRLIKRDRERQARLARREREPAR